MMYLPVSCMRFVAAILNMAWFMLLITDLSKADKMYTEAVSDFSREAS